MTYTVAIIGRPNVGKSTLFNRLTGTRHALVDDQPGVTRDRREGDAQIGPLRFRVIDTAGLEEGDSESLPGRMQWQTETAVADADTVLMLVDGRSGITPHDRYFVDWVRKCNKPVVLAVNKCERSNNFSMIADAFSLGLGDPVPISAEHGEGLADLHDALYEHAPADVDVDEVTEDGADRAIQIAIVGRPNAGKSTLMNALLGENRVLTGPEAGITRDSIAVNWEYKGKNIKLIDTAGMRRRANIDDKLEKLAVSDSIRSIRFAHVVVLLIDATQPMEKQELVIADHVVTEGRAMVLAVNKWDMVKDKKAAQEEIEYLVEEHLAQLKGVPIIMLSALKEKGVNDVLDACLQAYEVWNRRVSTAKLNDWLIDVEAQHPPPLDGNRRLRLRYITQAKQRPPGFILFVSKPDKLPESYQRYLINSLRKTFDMPGVPLRLTLRKNKNPYIKKK